MTDLLVRTTVNGHEVEGWIPTNVTLADYLRNSLGLTGTKVSCRMQVCGACTVLIDERPVSSCTFLACDADGSAVTTIESVATQGRLSAIQQAFVDRSALQCGFCTPGFVMMATALLRDNPHPTEDEVVHYLEGNICRCTGYVSIVEAIMQVSAQGHAEEGGTRAEPSRI